ncbi:cell division protein FtsA [Treponema sp. J25]|uniref:cell division protein FtsA n=1 Tax=Treponema sp. J25 TaxID=2094121 RepID=UPI00105048B7|nr:cell division protein FtsA [Treponema sp. J25]TCW62608.1 cell division protein FtsA [Treponema sp. J25]
MATDDVIVGLDIGTTKVCAVIGELNEQGLLEITGVGTAPSTGLRKGVVVNIEATLRSVAAAIEAAEMMSGREVHACWTGIGGSHIEGLNSRGVVAVTGKNRETREITNQDIERVIEAARAVVIPMDRQILHVIPQSYIVDDQRGIRNPLDMIGVRLEAEVHIITCSVTSAQNLIKCVNRAGFKVEDLVLQSLAAGRATLTQEEKELGVALVDLGGGTTDLLVYAEGAPYYTATIPVGGSQVTSDISIVKSIPYETAERIKIEAGCCWPGLFEYDEEIIVPGVGGRPPMPIPRSHLEKIIEPRMRELLMLVKEKLDKLQLSRPLGGGVVLTGGGALLAGLPELASELFNLPVRIGFPLAVGGLVEEYRNPLYATAVGLVMEGYDRLRQQKVEVLSEGRGKERSQPSWISRVIDWVRREFF